MFKAALYLDTRELAEGGDLIRRVHVGHRVVQQPRAVQVVGVLQGVRIVLLNACALGCSVALLSLSHHGARLSCCAATHAAAAIVCLGGAAVPA